MDVPYLSSPTPVGWFLLCFKNSIIITPQLFLSLAEDLISCNLFVYRSYSKHLVLPSVFFVYLIVFLYFYAQDGGLGTVCTTSAVSASWVSWSAIMISGFHSVLIPCLSSCCCTVEQFLLGTTLLWCQHFIPEQKVVWSPFNREKWNFVSLAYKCTSTVFLLT